MHVLRGNAFAAGRPKPQKPLFWLLFPRECCEESFGSTLFIGPTSKPVNHRHFKVVIGKEIEEQEEEVVFDVAVF